MSVHNVIRLFKIVGAENVFFFNCDAGNQKETEFPTNLNIGEIDWILRIVLSLKASQLIRLLRKFWCYQQSHVYPNVNQLLVVQIETDSDHFNFLVFKLLYYMFHRFKNILSRRIIITICKFKIVRRMNSFLRGRVRFFSIFVLPLLTSFTCESRSFKALSCQKVFGFFRRF